LVKLIEKIPTENLIPFSIVKNSCIGGKHFLFADFKVTELHDGGLDKAME
jgi:hypothetical protein